jgi:glycosyltransferase involved in cell wall biosynthesis
MRSELIFYAPNVGVGGGLVLVRSILKAWATKGPLTAILDERGRSAIGGLAAAHDIHWVSSSVKGRWQAERLLAQLARAQDAVLCFHNLPPILPVKGKILCFVHNPNLVGLVPSGSFSGWPRLRLAMENRIARAFRGRVHEYIVQTPSMAAALANQFDQGQEVPPIHVFPFLDMGELEQAISQSAALKAERRWDFLYVSDGVAHKNHRRLFAAWRILAEQGDFPSLAVTLRSDRDTVLRAELDAMVARYGLKIEDLGQRPHAEILATYHQAGAMIFPSFAESFGIPLIEAQVAGIPILASELDYARDMCDPVESFDPYSERSIARAVERFLYKRSGKAEMKSPGEFMDRVLAIADDVKS